jgi:hypothetical protein
MVHFFVRALESEISCERTDRYINLFPKKLSTRNSLNYIHNDRYCNRKKLSHSSEKCSIIVKFNLKTAIFRNHWLIKFMNVFVLVTFPCIDFTLIHDNMRVVKSWNFDISQWQVLQSEKAFTFFWEMLNNYLTIRQIPKFSMLKCLLVLWKFWQYLFVSTLVCTLSCCDNLYLSFTWLFDV